MPREAQDQRSAFINRLELLAAKLGSRYKLAQKAGIKQSTLQAYASGSEPTRPALIKLARAADVSIDWLAAGQRREIDVELLRQVIEGVERGFRGSGIRLDARSRAQMIAEIYAAVTEEELPDEARHAKIVELVRWRQRA